MTSKPVFDKNMDYYCLVTKYNEETKLNEAVLVVRSIEIERIIEEL